MPLDGRASIGDITDYAWSTDDGTVTPDPTNPGLATWTPDTPNPAATITLTVTGPGGGSTASNTVVVTQPIVVLADAGPDQVKTRGQVVALSGTATGQRSVLWTQVSGPPVTLSGATTLHPTFTYPRMALPVGPAGHVTAGYAVHNEPIVLQLAATAVSGGTTVTDTVQISPTTETITPGTARYRIRGEWRVTGTTDLVAGQTVAMVLGSDLATGTFIGQATVDAAGAFSFKGGGRAGGCRIHGHLRQRDGRHRHRTSPDHALIDHAVPGPLRAGHRALLVRILRKTGRHEPHPPHASQARRRRSDHGAAGPGAGLGDPRGAVAGFSRSGSGG